MMNKKNALNNNHFILEDLCEKCTPYACDCTDRVNPQAIEHWQMIERMNQSDCERFDAINEKKL